MSKRDVQVVIQPNSDTVVLRNLARIFAGEWIANDIHWTGEKLPYRFTRLVADEMVRQPEIGWPDRESALQYLREIGWA